MKAKISNTYLLPSSKKDTSGKSYVRINDSTDGSREIAKRLGAVVTHCVERGYGATCLYAMNDLEERGGCEVLLFMDADGADDPEELGSLCLLLWCRVISISPWANVRPGWRIPGALLPQARYGNMLAVFLMRLVWRYRFKDLGPYRALRWPSLVQLRMDDRNFGWTIQMQIRAVREKLRITEIPVRYRKRHAGKK